MRTVFYSKAILVTSLFLVFLFLPKSTSAMTLPPLIEYDGLAIEQPLTFSDTAGRERLTLAFGEIQKSEPTILSKSETAENESAVVSLPSPAEDKEVLGDTTSTKITPSPTQSLKTEKSTPTPIKTFPTTTPIPATPSPTQAALAAAAPAQLSNGGLNADTLFSMSNSYRASKGLPAFAKDDRACQLAASRAPEIAAEIAEGRMHSGLAARNLPYWNTENIITMRTESEAFNWWINDQIHHDAIVGNYTYSCVACSGNACAQEFTNFQSK